MLVVIGSLLHGRDLELDFIVFLAVEPELGQDGAVCRALEERAQHELQRAARRLIVRHLVQVTEEPHADERDGQAGSVPSRAIQPELGHAKQRLHHQKQPLAVPA